MGAKAWTMVALTGTVLTGLGYVVYPCVMLYRLDQAVARGDTTALRAMVDWPEVRQGLEFDLASGDKDQLAPFGASFLRTVAVKTAMTPENVMAALHAVDGRDHADPLPRFRGVWPEGPFAAIVDLGTVRLRVQLRGAEWQVTRAWLPPTVLTEARAIAQR